MTTNRRARRRFLQLAGASLVAGSMSGWMGRFAAATAGSKPPRSCILLWMNGGPSQLDTFDLKPGHVNGGPFAEIQTSTPGVRISEHLPNVARWTHRLAIVRSMTNKEADHGRATYFVRTGRPPQGPLQYPALGSVIAKERGATDSSLPNFISIAPLRSTNPAAYDAGFLGPSLAPFVIGDMSLADSSSTGPDAYMQWLRVTDISATGAISPDRIATRRNLLSDFNASFADHRSDAPLASRRAAYERAMKLMRPASVEAFDLETEDPALRDRYGRNLFGQGCLLARRLVERGVPFVEVSLGGVNSGGMAWDTHVNNFETVTKLSQVLDPAWATLLSDLDDRGLLDSTLIVWTGEFGRTPHINGAAGRDHYPLAWSAVLGGGPIAGGSVIGATTADGVEVADQPVAVPELLATVCAALGIDPHKTNTTPVGRPVHLVDYDAHPIPGVVTTEHAG